MPRVSRPRFAESIRRSMEPELMIKREIVEEEEDVKDVKPLILAPFRPIVKRPEPRAAAPEKPTLRIKKEEPAEAPEKQLPTIPEVPNVRQEEDASPVPAPVQITDRNCPWCARQLASPRGVSVHALQKHSDEYAAYRKQSGKVSKRRGGRVASRAVRAGSEPVVHSQSSPSTNSYICAPCNRDCTNLAGQKSHERGKLHLAAVGVQMKELAQAKKKSTSRAMTGKRKTRN